MDDRSIHPIEVLESNPLLEAFGNVTALSLFFKNDFHWVRVFGEMFSFFLGVSVVEKASQFIFFDEARDCPYTELESQLDSSGFSEKKVHSPEIPNE